MKSLRDRRIAAGLPQNKVADEAGIHFTYLSKIEKGSQKPSPETLKRIEEAIEDLVIRRAQNPEAALNIAHPGIDKILLTKRQFRRLINRRELLVSRNGHKTLIGEKADQRKAKLIERIEKLKQKLELL